MTDADQQGHPRCSHAACVSMMKQGSLTTVAGIRGMYTLTMLQNGALMTLSILFAAPLAWTFIGWCVTPYFTSIVFFSMELPKTGLPSAKPG